MIHKFLLLFAALVLISNASTCQNVDINLLRDINQNRNRSLDGTFRFITNSGAPISVGIPVCMFGFGLIDGDSALVRNAMVIGASVVSSTIMTTIIKNIVRRPRPFTTYPDIEKLTSGGGYSFPSGHTSGAFSFATSLSLEYPKWYIIVPSYAWASAVAYSRMDLGVHYPSDILMGAAVGAGSAYLCHYINKRIFRKRILKYW
ncbi:MAG: phosphatase PAP2 family protein [Bacteroidales bacterium]|nr:phosphatase PAP2 family protein [Bacteroidales bacterium]MDD3907255.1 phosphatase PAP2 family protein [Bacteroidales bacterium]MDD4712548.1 phosphatase PAP2 family protein [Bacteroidales bacterium]